MLLITTTAVCCVADRTGELTPLTWRRAMYLPPLLEALGKAELIHEPRTNKVRAIV
jgi:hypothetical protein